jgi:hypothetical protein
MPQTFGKPRFRYHSLILAFWQEADEPADDHAGWRFSLEDPHTGERVGFKSIEELAGYVQGQTQAPAEDKPP